MKRIVYIFISVFLISTCSEMETKWVKKFNVAGPGNYRINDISCSKTNTYATGTYWTADVGPSCITAAYDADGELVWHSTYEPQDLKAAAGRSIWIIKRELVEASPDIYVLVQTTDSKDISSVVVIKYDSLGSIQWEKVIEKSKREVASVMLFDHLYNLYVAGWTVDTKDAVDMFIVKYRSSGELAWSTKYQNPSFMFHGLKFNVRRSGELLVAGLLENTQDFFFMRYDSLGRFIRMTEHKTSAQESSLAGVQTDDEGRVYLTGTTNNSETEKDYYTVVYDKNDSLLWEKGFDGPAHHDDVSKALAVGDSSVYVTGSSENEEGVSELLTVKYDQTGNELWTKIFKGRKGESAEPYIISSPYIRCAKNEAVGNFYITGFVGDDALVLKHNTKGFITWVTRHSIAGKVNRPSALSSYCIAVESMSDKGTDAYILKFGKSEQFGLTRWD